MADNLNTKNMYQDESPDLGHKINPIPVPETQIGVDTDDAFYDSIIEGGESASVDITKINAFTQITNNRETLYETLDTMAQDSTVSAVLETYAEDATETNEQGDVVWAESSDPKILRYVTFLLNSLNVDKYIYQWVYSLCKYGDVYLRMYRESDFEDNLLKDDDEEDRTLNEKFAQANETIEDKEELTEDVIIKYYKKDDRLVNYIEMIPNPAEMFELTKFGKSYAYIKTNSVPKLDQDNNNNVFTNFYLYRLKRNDVNIYNAVSFVHACLQDDTPRFPEQVQIFNDYSAEDNAAYVYSVRRGQSVLYNSYKIWRENMLLENALLLNRITKSALLRIIEVEVADMPKDKVRERLQRIKSLIEQKSSIDTGNMMSEYVNPGPMENTIYVPTKSGVGAINTQQVGGDVNIRDIADIDYFKNKLFAAWKIPKQFFGETDDSTGFNGGTSLTILSSRYAKTIKRIQTAMIQALTDAINILLIDRGLDSYVNKFNLMMQAPITQEELDKRDSLSSEIALVDDILRMLDMIEDPITKLKILKSLLSNVISNQEVIELIQSQIDELEQQAEEQAQEELGDDMDLGGLDLGGGGSSGGGDSFADDFGSGLEDTAGDDFASDFEAGAGEDLGGDLGGDTLPTPADLGGGLDFTGEI